MEEIVPTFLRNKVRILDVCYGDDGSFDLMMLIEIQNHDKFIPFLSYKELTEKEKKEVAWLAAFKKHHADLWAQGYNLTSKRTSYGTIYGCTKDGEYRDLETYHSEYSDYSDVPIVVKLESLSPEYNFEIFNSLLYGYDAISAGIKEKQSPVKFKKKSRCRICGCGTYRVYVNIHSTGKQDLLEEQKCINITADNWMNAFDLISIDLKCSNCGRMTKRWFEFETM